MPEASKYLENTEEPHWGSLEKRASKKTLDVDLRFQTLRWFYFRFVVFAPVRDGTAPA